MNISSSRGHKCHPLLGTADFFTLEHQQHYDNFFIFILVVNVVCAVCTTVSNAVAIYTLIRTTSLHIPSNILILGLTLSNITVSTLSQPSYSIMKYSEYTRNLKLFCRVGMVYHISITGLVFVSFLTLTAITTDRFLALRLHLRYQEFITIPRCTIMLLIIWCMSIFCGVNRLISDTLNLYFLLKIHFVIKRHKICINIQGAKCKTLNMKRYKKSINTLHCILGGILLCYLPLISAIITHFVFHEQSDYPILAYFAFAETCLMSNGLINVAIYFWKNTEFRQAAKRLLWRKKNKIFQPQ